MPDPNWTRTRAALVSMGPINSARLLPKLLVKGPRIITAAQRLLAEHSFTEDRFKILMVHELERELPEFQDIYNAILADLMHGRPQLS